jgi:drug/metabolite transporter (DMT)-like permease
VASVDTQFGVLGHGFSETLIDGDVLYTARAVSRRLLITEAVIALALFGCIPVAVKYVQANAFTIGIFRLSLATAVMAALAAWRGELRQLPRTDVARLVLIGFLFFAHWLTYFLAIKLATASIAAIGLSTYGVDLLLFGALGGHGRIHGRDIVAVGLAVAGAVMVVPDFQLGNGMLGGMALALLSALCYAALPILHQRAAHIPTSLRTLGQFGFALLFFLIFLPWSNWHLTPRDWGGLLFLAIAATLIAHTLWVRVTTRLSPAAASVLYYGNVPFAIALGVVVLHEPLTWRTVMGAALIIGGSLLGFDGVKENPQTSQHEPETRPAG